MGDKVMNKDYPDQEQRAGVCYTQWRKPKQSIEFKYQVPIKEIKNEEKNGDFIIEGTAINVTTTSNGHKFLEEELEPSAHTLNDVPLLKDHRNEVDYIMGRVKEGKYGDRKITFRAKVIDKNVQEMIRDGRLNSVSVGAMVESFDIDEDDESYVARGITFKELSLVAVGADEGATFGIALSEAYKMTTGIKNKEVVTITDKKVDEGAPETFTQEQLDATVAEAVKKAMEVKLVEDAKLKEIADKKIADEAVAKEAKEAADKKLAEIKKVAEEKAVKEAEIAAELAEEEAAKVKEKELGYKFVESSGSLKGGSMTMERVI